MTLAQLFSDAVQYDEPRLAYTIYWANQNGLSAHSNFETLKTLDINHSEVNELIRSNPLNIGHIKLYTCKDGELFHLVLAESEMEAKRTILTEAGFVPKQMHDVSHGMDKFVWDDIAKKEICIRGVKDAALKFPVYLGMIEKE